jgi:transposase-like protein
MSESTDSVSADGKDLGVEPPKAIVHKKILDVAAARPDASIEAIANDVSGATATLVEQVLDEYGDPGSASADDQGAGHSDTPEDSETVAPTSEGTDDERSEPDIVTGRVTTQTESDGADTSVPDPEELTTKQRQTVRLIAERPDATQAEIAAELDVTSSTISQRVNAIDGFDWSERTEFVERMLENGDETTEETALTLDEEPDMERSEAGTSSEERGSDETVSDAPHESDPRTTEDSPEGLDESLDDGAVLSRIDDLATRLDSIERRLAERAEGTSNQESVPELSGRFDDLAAKLEVIEDRIESTTSSSNGVSDDPELAHKIVHACIDSETVSEDEELQILKTILDTEE